MKNPILPLIFCVFSVLAHSQITQVHGVVSDQRGERLSGISVAVLNGNISVFTGAEGDFRLYVPPGHDTLIFAGIGYQTLRIPIPSSFPAYVTLESERYLLDEVVVIGFGERSRRQLASAVSSTGASSFESIPVPNWERALQGRLPGVSVTSASGGLDAGAAIRVRGTGSISAGNQPLMVVDGIVLSGMNGSWSYGVATNPFITLNPEDIESVEVLKDAAAAAIYGARGSNGVLLITSKKGAWQAKPEIRLGYYVGFSEISKRYDLLNGKEYAALWNEAALNAGETWAIYDVDEQPDTDWQSLLLRRGFVQQSHASVSGGGPKSRYYISGVYRDEDGYLITTNLKRYSFQAQVETHFGERFTAGGSIAPTRVINNRVGNQWTGSAFGWAAWYFPNVEAFHPDGSPIRDPLRTSIGMGLSSGNPLLIATDQSATVTTQQLLGRGFLEYKLIPELRLRTELGTELTEDMEWTYMGPATFFGRNGGQGSVLNQDISSIQWTNQLFWTPSLSRAHDFNITAGTHFVRTQFSGTTVFGQNFPSDQIKLLLSTAQVRGYEGWRATSAFMGYFARAHYAWNYRMLLSISARYDGSSRFGAGNRYGFFPAVSTGWIAVDKTRAQSGFLRFLKVRSSIGLTGNAEIGEFSARGLVGLNYDYQQMSGYVIESLENRDLSWEKGMQWDIGLDFALWNNRLRGTLDYFIKDTRGLLFEVPVPATNGVRTILDNEGLVRNSGFELSLSADLLRGPFQWNVELNGATLRNRILRLADLDGDGMDDEIIMEGRHLLRPGHPIGAFYLVRYAGVDRNTGDALFFDLEGNTHANFAPAENRQIVGSPLPRFTGGMAHTFRYKRLDLSAFFHFKTGHSIYIMHSDREDNMAGGFNQFRTQLDAWRPNNTDTDVPQARLWQINGNQVSTRYLHRADFIRLNNLSLGYSLPPIGKSGAKTRVYFSSQNLFTLTAFPGLDPDVEFFHFNDAVQGGVLYNLPAARTFILGADIAF